MNSKTKIPETILKKIKSYYYWDIPFDEVIQYMYDMHEKYPEGACYDWERRTNYVDERSIETHKLFDVPIKEAIKYLQTLPQDYTLVMSYQYGEEIPTIEKSGCVEPDDKYIERLAKKCYEVNRIMYSEKRDKEELIKEKKELEKRLAEINTKLK